ncbi:hypothetical protein GDO81_013461 [Engystomops pustulosus]|uniref:NADH dehydrogenase subunit 4L n=1 Tax=Engystomops pustulosus TaxID=76066 RepID=A0AAV7B1R7_ENGPU|nr:hypothetical protein GDO81_013461 [Engystomops pustulosus]
MCSRRMCELHLGLFTGLIMSITMIMTILLLLIIIVVVVVVISCMVANTPPKVIYFAVEFVNSVYLYLENNAHIINRTYSNIHI